MQPVEVLRHEHAFGEVHFTCGRTSWVAMPPYARQDWLGVARPPVSDGEIVPVACDLSDFPTFLRAWRDLHLASHWLLVRAGIDAGVSGGGAEVERMATILRKWGASIPVEGSAAGSLNTLEALRRMLGFDGRPFESALTVMHAVRPDARERLFALHRTPPQKAGEDEKGVEMVAETLLKAGVDLDLVARGLRATALLASPESSEWQQRLMQWSRAAQRRGQATQNVSLGV